MSMLIWIIGKVLSHGFWPNGMSTDGIANKSGDLATRKSTLWLDIQVKLSDDLIPYIYNV